MKYITDEDYATAEKNGIKRATVRSRVMDWNWDIEKAITTPARNFVKIPPQILRTLKKNKISIGTYKGRINVGWSIERAMTEPVGKIGPRRKQGGE